MFKAVAISNQPSAPNGTLSTVIIKIWRLPMHCYWKSGQTDRVGAKTPVFSIDIRNKFN